MATTNLTFPASMLENLHQWRVSIYRLLAKPLVYHSLFWILYFLFNVIRWGTYHQDYVHALYNNLIEFPLHIALAYVNIYYLIPKYLPKKYVQYIALISLGVLAAVLGRMVVEDFFAVSPNNNLTTGQYILELVIGEVYVQGFITAFKFLLDWGRNQKRMRELQKVNYETELNFLRSQVQPHFFFNTLNNLYSLALDKSDLAPETVLKLSDLMSYVIYEGKRRQVSLSREITYIQNYLDLERLRFGDKLKVSFVVHGQVEDQKVPPLLTLPFIENSFKHGVGDKIEEVTIDIGIDVREEGVIFTISNRKFETLTPSPSQYHHLGHRGVGIKNVKRRLKLIYGDQYHLEINDETDNYTVTLNIPTYEDKMSNSG